MQVRFLAGAIVAACLYGVAQPAAAACIPIFTADELQAMRHNLAGIYCLRADIDLRSKPNFIPIGTTATPFTGNLNGNNHTIRNLQIERPLEGVGLFGVINGGKVANLTILNAEITATRDPAISMANAGLLAGNLMGGSVVRNVHVDGVVTCTMPCNAGGMLGVVSGLVQKASSAANVRVLMGSSAGGLAARLDGNDSAIQLSFATGRLSCGEGSLCAGFVASMVNVATIQFSYATARVTCSISSFCAGLVASTVGSNIFRSFSAGTVTCDDGSFCGGLVAGAIDATVNNAYSSSNVFYGDGSFVGGLIGSAIGTTIDQVYANGPMVAGGTGGFVGGLIGAALTTTTLTNGFWDVETTGVMTSAGGAPGLTTDQLRAALPGTFAPTVWGITPDLSYPYLLAASLDFKSPLATLVISSKLVIALPISQFDKSNYGGSTNHIDEASLAACYTMLARAIGTALNLTSLRNVKIDRFFWDDAAQQTQFRGPVTDFATLGPFLAINPNVPLRNNVVAEMKDEHLVLLRGTYQRGGQTVRTWLLGTLFTSEADGSLIAVLANDPFTGQQVEIDPHSKTVVSPGHFPLTNFKVEGYRPVIIDFFT